MSAEKPTLCYTNTIAAAVGNIAIQHPNGIRVVVTDAETGDQVASLRTQTRAELAPKPAPRVTDAARVVPFKVAPMPKPALAAVPDDDLDEADEEGSEDPEDDGPCVAESGIEACDATEYDPRDATVAHLVSEELRAKVPISASDRRRFWSIGRGPGVTL